MNRPGALGSVLALFFSGVAIGAFGVHIFEERYPRMGPPDGPRRGRGALDVLEVELDLTSEQRRSIEDIADENHRLVEQIRREIRPRIDQQVDETERKLVALLTPEQREKFDRLLKEERVRPIGLFLGPPPLPPPRGGPGPGRFHDGPPQH